MAQKAANQPEVDKDSKVTASNMTVEQLGMTLHQLLLAEEAVGPSLAGRVTGMLLEMPRPELERCLQDTTLRMQHTVACLDVLGSHSAVGR